MYTFIYYNNKVYLYTASSTVHDMPRLQESATSEDTEWS